MYILNEYYAFRRGISSYDNIIITAIIIKHYRCTLLVYFTLTLDFPAQTGVWLLPTYHEPYHSQRAIWTCLTMFANLTVCLLGWWKCFANNYLQWAAVFTWCFINVQGAHAIKYLFYIYIYVHSKLL